MLAAMLNRSPLVLVSARALYKRVMATKASVLLNTRQQISQLSALKNMRSV